MVTDRDRKEDLGRDASSCLYLILLQFLCFHITYSSRCHQHSLFLPILSPSPITLPNTLLRLRLTTATLLREVIRKRSTETHTQSCREWLPVVSALPTCIRAANGCESEKEEDERMGVTGRAGVSLGEDMSRKMGALVRTLQCGSSCYCTCQRLEVLRLSLKRDIDTLSEGSWVINQTMAQFFTKPPLIRGCGSGHPDYRCHIHGEQQYHHSSE